MPVKQSHREHCPRSPREREVPQALDSWAQKNRRALPPARRAYRLGAWQPPLAHRSPLAPHWWNDFLAIATRALSYGEPVRLALQWLGWVGLDYDRRTRTQSPVD